MLSLLGIGLVPDRLDSWSSVDQFQHLDAVSCGEGLACIARQDFDLILFDSRCSDHVDEDIENLLSLSSATTKLVVILDKRDLQQIDQLTKLGIDTLSAPLVRKQLDQYVN